MLGALGINVPTTAKAESGFLGIQVQGLGAKASKVLGLLSPGGVLVKDVAVGEPGAIAGIRRGDLITKFNNRVISKFEDLISAVGTTKSGQKVTVEVRRQNKRVKLILVTTRRPAQWNVKKGAFHHYPDIGFTVAALTEKVRKKFFIRWGATGLVVTMVDSESIISSGLRPGDVILQANLRDLWHPGQLTQKIDAARKSGNENLLLLIEGYEGYRYALLPLEK